MTYPSSRNLSHDFQAYKGLTLRELLLMTLATTAFFILSFVILGVLLGHTVLLGCLGFLLGFIASVTIMPKPIARLKAGKPYGYLMKSTVNRLANAGLMPSPYVKHVGFWQKSRAFRRGDV